MSDNREYKSDVFSMLLEDPKNALEVYNYLNGSHYEDASQVEMKNLGKGISLTVRNDAAFIIDMNLNVYEHQSTYNPNMPLRALFYLVDILRSMLGRRDLYSSHRIMIPNPKFAVFYNGEDNRPECEILHLSDSYEHPEENPQLELTCVVYNINLGKNDELLQNCSVLHQYMLFVDKVREYHGAGDTEMEVRRAVEYCIDHHILETFLKNRKDEVIKSMCIDMTFERREELIREEEREYGREEGRIEGREEGRIAALNQGLEVLVRSLKPLISDFETLYEMVRKNEIYSSCTKEEVHRIYEKF